MEGGLVNKPAWWKIVEYVQGNTKKLPDKGICTYQPQECAAVTFYNMESIRPHDTQLKGLMRVAPHCSPLYKALCESGRLYSGMENPAR